MSPLLIPGLNRMQSVIVFVLAMVVFVLYATIRTSWEQGSDGQLEIDTIAVLQPVIGTTLFCLAAFFALGLFAASAFSVWRPTIHHPRIALTLAILAFPYSCLHHALSNLGPWTQHGQITTNDGSTYVFCDSSFLQGQTMAIARVDREGVFVKRFKVMVTAYGDSPRRWASVVRRANPIERYGQLYLTEDDILVGVRGGNHCYLAYELLSRRPIRGDDIERLSPFILLEHGTALHEPDVAATIELMKGTIEFLGACEDIRHAAGYLDGDLSPGYPSEPALRNGLKHDNPLVQEAAKRLLSVHIDGIALIRSRVSNKVEELRKELTSSDVETRRRAAQALGGIGELEATSAVPELTAAAASDHDRETRLYASQALGSIGPAALPSLIELMQHRDSDVRSNAIFGLQMAGESAKTPETVSALKSALKDVDKHIRVRAAKLLETTRQ